MSAPRLPRSYWRLWWASAIDTVGDGAFAAAIPLLAVTITHDPRLVSVVSAATFLPWLVLSLPIGAIVDRRDRVTLMWHSQAAQAIVVAAIGLLAALGHADIASVAVLAFVLGIGEVVFGNASQAVLPQLVPSNLLASANGKQYSVTTIGQLFLGPPLGSVLFAVAVGLPFGVDAASFALSAALLATLPRARPEPRAHPPIRTAVREGLRWLLGHRLLRTIAVLLGVNNFCNMLGNATLVLLATQRLHVGPRGFGVLLAVSAIGAVAGGLVNARIAARLGMLQALVVALAANVAVYVAIGFVQDAVELGALLAVNGFVTTLWNVATVSLRQQIVPNDLLGRVNSVYRMLGWGLLPLGAIASGFVAHSFGLRAPFPVAGALRGVALVIALPVLIAAMRGFTLERESQDAAGRRSG